MVRKWNTWRSRLVSEQGQVYAFAVVWMICVVLPMIGIVVFSFLTAKGLKFQWVFTMDAYSDLISSGRWNVALRTIRVAAIVTIIELLIGFPFALWLAKGAKSALLKLVIWTLLTVPFFLDPSARTLIWRVVLGRTGLVNSLLLHLGIIDEPIEWLLFSSFSVHFGFIGPYFPNMVWPVFLAIILIDDELLQASKDLGGSPLDTLFRIIVPLAMPGIIAGSIFTFVPILGDSVIPKLLGGSRTEYLADSVFSLITALNYAGAAAFATIILIIMLAMQILLQGMMRRRGGVAAVFEGMQA